MTNDYILVNWTDYKEYPPSIDTTDNETIPGSKWLKVTNCKDGWLEEEDGIERFRPYLSPREFEVAQLVSESYSQRKAAELLGVDRRTVREIFKRVKRKIICVLQKKLI